MRFKEWMIIFEGGKGSGNKKITATGFNAGGQSQAGIGMFKPAKPHLKINMKVK